MNHDLAQLLACARYVEDAKDSIQGMRPRPRTGPQGDHDFGPEAGGGEFLVRLARYLRSADRDNAEALERWGIRVIGMRHHSGNFILDGEPDGFPVQYLTLQPLSGE